MPRLIFPTLQNIRSTCTCENKPVTAAAKPPAEDVHSTCISMLNTIRHCLGLVLCHLFSKRHAYIYSPGLAESVIMTPPGGINGDTGCSVSCKYPLRIHKYFHTHCKLEAFIYPSFNASWGKELKVYQCRNTLLGITEKLVT